MCWKVMSVDGMERDGDGMRMGRRIFLSGGFVYIYIGRCWQH